MTAALRHTAPAATLDRPVEVIVDGHPELAPISIEAFASLFRTHPGGVVVLTAQTADGRRAGFTATSLISVSAEPPIVAFSMNTTSSAWPVFSEAQSAQVHFIGEDELEIAQRFSTSGIDRFADVTWTPSNTGEPVLHDVHVSARVELRSVTPVAGSALFVAEITHVRNSDDVAPAIYFNRGYRSLAAQA